MALKKNEKPWKVSDTALEKRSLDESENRLTVNRLKVSSKLLDTVWFKWFSKA